MAGSSLSWLASCRLVDVSGARLRLIDFVGVGGSAFVIRSAACVGVGRGIRGAAFAGIGRLARVAAPRAELIGAAALEDGVVARYVAAEVAGRTAPGRGSRRAAGLRGSAWRRREARSTTSSAVLFALPGRA